MCFLIELFFLVEFFFLVDFYMKWPLISVRCVYKYLFKGKCKKGTIWGLYWRLDRKRKISFSEATTYLIQFFSTCIGCCVCWAKKNYNRNYLQIFFCVIHSTYLVHTQCHQDHVSVQALKNRSTEAPQ